MNNNDVELYSILEKLGSSIVDKIEIFQELYSYCVKTDRYLYSNITEWIENKSKYDEQVFYFLLMNIEYLANCLEKETSIMEDLEMHFKNNLNKYDYLEKEEFKKRLCKLYDHVALEQKRVVFSKEREDKVVNYSIERINYAMDDFNRIYSEKTENLNTNIITIVGIFSAIIFVFFGGMSSMTSLLELFSKSKENNMYTIAGIIIIGLIMFDIIFLLLYCVSKMTDKNIGLLTENNHYYYNKLSVHYWDIYNIKLYEEPGYIDGDFFVRDNGPKLNLKEEKKKLIKQNRKKYKVRTKSFFQYIRNGFIIISYNIIDSWVFIGLRRFPFICLLNIVSILSIIFLLTMC